MSVLFTEPSSPQLDAGSSPRVRYSAEGLSAILVFAAFVLSRWPYWLHWNINPDALSYWSVGSSWAHGRGFVWPIRPYFYPSNISAVSPVVGYLSIPLTGLLALAQRMGIGFCDASNLMGIFALIDAWLVYRLTRAWGSRTAALIATVLFVVNPEVVRSTTTLWTEPLSLTFFLTAYWLAETSVLRCDGDLHGRYCGYPQDRLQSRASRGILSRSLLCGICLGLGYLTRPGDVVYLGAILMTSAVLGRWRPALIMLIGAFLTALPYWICNEVINGSPFFTMYTLLTRTMFYGEAMYTGFDRHYPSAGYFLLHHGRGVGGEVIRNFSLCIQLLGGAGRLGPLVLAILVSYFMRRRVRGLLCAVRMPPVAVAMALGGILNLAFSAMAWSTHEEARFMLGTWSVALIVLTSWLDPDVACELASMGEKTGSGRGWDIRAKAACGWRDIRPGEKALIVAFCATLTANIITLRDDFRSLCDDGGRNWREAQVVRYMPAAHAIRMLSRPGDVVAGSDPWIVNFITGRPCVLLPALRPGELALFLRRYRPRLIVSDVTREPNPVVHDDFGSIASRTWRQRDWELGTLWRAPWLEEIPLNDRREIRVFLVKSLPEGASSKPGRKAGGSL